MGGYGEGTTYRNASQRISTQDAQLETMRSPARGVHVSFRGALRLRWGGQRSRELRRRAHSPPFPCHDVHRNPIQPREEERQAREERGEEVSDRSM